MSFFRTAARLATLAAFTAALLAVPGSLKETRAAADYTRALRRAEYLLNASVPDDAAFTRYAGKDTDYRTAVRAFLDHPNFYDAVLRYHERVLGVGLPSEYLDELQRSDIDGKELKIARLRCARGGGARARFGCEWEGGDTGRARTGQCPKAMQEPVTPFWKPDVVVWVCPSVARACGSNLSKCFVEFADENEAKNTELGTSEAFDSRFTIIKSLSRQPAGLATAVAVNNYPYTKIIEPGLTAVDGALAHFYGQTNHFDLTKMSLPQNLLDQLARVSVNDTRFQLVYTGNHYEHAGVLSTFGWMRRYEKNRSRANQLYERLMCRRFTSEPPKVFPQDPGNLRTTAPCSGCHATLDPLADFYSAWGEGGDLYRGSKAARTSRFAGKSGTTMADLAHIIQNDEAFATCTVQNVWEWLMGRKFYRDEEKLRDELTKYFVGTKYSFRELVYAVATHPAFTAATRMDAVVTDPLEQPPLGKVPEAAQQPCPPVVEYSDFASDTSQCTVCHAAGTNRRSLETEQDWRSLGRTALGMLSSGSMPPGQSGPPVAGPAFDLKEALRCWVKQEGL